MANFLSTILCVAVITTVIMTAIFRWVAHDLDIVDKPDNHVKTHTKPTAYLGGCAIFTGFLIAYGYALIWHNSLLNQIPCAIHALLIGGSLAMCVLGLLDDLKDISPLKKILGQTILALIFVFLMQNTTGGSVHRFDSSLCWVLMSGLTWICLVGAMNSINLLDGLDGLCAGIAAIISLGFGLLSLFCSSDNSMINLIAATALLGVTAGFLVFNYYPASIFMGDSGSLFVGYIFAFQIIHFFSISISAFLAALMIFGLPILECSVAILRRWLNNRDIFLSDRGHIYDQLIDRGYSIIKAVWFCYGLSVFYTAVGLFGLIFHWRLAIVIYIAVMLISFAIIWKMGFLKKV